MSQHIIRGLEEFVYDTDEAEISDEDEDALQQLPMPVARSSIQASVRDLWAKHLQLGGAADNELPVECSDCLEPAPKSLCNICNKQLCDDCAANHAVECNVSAMFKLLARTSMSRPSVA